MSPCASPQAVSHQAQTRGRSPETRDEKERAPRRGSRLKQHPAARQTGLPAGRPTGRRPARRTSAELVQSDGVSLTRGAETLFSTSYGEEGHSVQSTVGNGRTARRGRLGSPTVSPEDRDQFKQRASTPRTTAYGNRSRAVATPAGTPNNHRSARARRFPAGVTPWLGVGGITARHRAWNLGPSIYRYSEITRREQCRGLLRRCQSGSDL